MLDLVISWINELIDTASILYGSASDFLFGKSFKFLKSLTLFEVEIIL